MGNQITQEKDEKDEGLDTPYQIDLQRKPSKNTSNKPQKEIPITAMPEKQEKENQTCSDNSSSNQDGLNNRADQTAQNTNIAGLDVETIGSQQPSEVKEVKDKKKKQAPKEAKSKPEVKDSPKTNVESDEERPRARPRSSKRSSKTNKSFSEQSSEKSRSIPFSQLPSPQLSVNKDMVTSFQSPSLDSETGSTDDVDDMEPVEVLLQYIPYYGQGDPSNDSIVRSTLSGLSVEDIDSKDEYGNTLLLLACQYRCEDLVRIMLNKGANPNAINTSGACCLHFACYRESASYTIAKTLLQNGANPDVAETTFGCTPLHYCAGTGDIEFCKLLMAYGAQIETFDYYNYTCVDYAREGGLTELVNFLQNRLEKVQNQSKLRGFKDSFRGSALTAVHEHVDMAEWEVHTDPSSGGRYYMNLQSNEVVWESELLRRLELDGQQPDLSKLKSTKVSGTNTIETLSKSSSETNLPQSRRPSLSKELINGMKPNLESSPFMPNLLSTYALQTTLTHFFMKYDEKGLGNMESLIEKYKGKEIELIKLLCQNYKADEAMELNSFQKKLQEVQSKFGQPPPQPGNNSQGIEHSSSSMIRKSSMSPTESSSSSNNGNGLNSIVNNGASFRINPPLAMRHPTTSVNATTQTLPPPVEKITDLNLIDPVIIQNIVNEVKQRYENLLEEEKIKCRQLEIEWQEKSDEFQKQFNIKLDEEKLIKKRKEMLLDEEISLLKTQIIEKNSGMDKLRAEKDSMEREKKSIEEDNATLKLKIERLQSQGGEAMAQLESDLTTSKNEMNALKQQIFSTQQDLITEQNRVKSLEMTLNSLTLGKEEMMAQEKLATEQRALAQRDREEQFNNELKEMENRMKSMEMKLKSELNKGKSDWMRLEHELKDQFDQMKRMKDKEIDVAKRELDERTAQFAQDISVATLKISDLEKLVEESQKRSDEAEAHANALHAEILEAKQVQKYNAQLHKDLTREQNARKKLHNEMEDLKGKIRVYVRVRPFSKSEKERGCTEAVIKDGKMTVLVKGIGAPDAKKYYDFDQVFGGMEGNSQAEVFRDTKHLIMSVVDGYNVCIFAYGQTGAGKSFTMIGAADISNCMSENGDFDELAGITPRAVSELFRLLNERSAQVSFEVEVQMFQLYRDGLDDLLYDKKKKGDNPPPLKITLAEHSPTGLVNVEGAESMVALTPGDVMKIFSKGSARRTTASTQMNAESSRSHLICSLVVKLTNKRTKNQSVGKLTLVDLAGSERVDKSGAAGEVLKEAQSINKSLSALGDVIAALTTGQQHIPYRNHPLTMLMSDSIGGNAKTLMFVNTSPADYNNAESNSSLGFASRCKNITNSVAAAPGVQTAQVNALKKELAKMKKAEKVGGGKVVLPPMQNLERPQTAAKQN